MTCRVVRSSALHGRTYLELHLRGFALGEIAEILGFHGVDYLMGPFLCSPSRDRSGLQIDLLFSRADRVISLCEMKVSRTPVGMAVTREVERKATLLESLYPRMTIQRVLVLHGEPSRDLLQSGYFYRIIRSTELAG